MRILHAIHSIDPASGGPAEVIKQFSATALSHGCVSEVVSLDPPDAPYLSDFPMPLQAFGPGKGKFGYNPRFQDWLRQRAADFDAVVVDGIWQYHSLAVWRALRHSQTPYVVFTHGMLDPWFKREYPLKHLKKLPYWLAFERRVLRDAAAVVYTCEEERILARQSFPLYRAQERILHLGTAVPATSASQQDDAGSLVGGNLQRDAFLSRYPHLNDKRIALFLGRVHPKKGCDLLIQAFAECFRADAGWHLVIAGPDQVSWQSELETLAGKLGIAQQITWTGMLSGLEKWGAYRASEIFILPSHQENFGIAVAEALACGLPVLLSKKVNIWREVEEAGAAFVANDDLLGTVSLLQRWRSLDRAARQRMKIAALDCFRAKFHAGRATQNFIELLASLTSARDVEAVHA